MCSRDPLTNLVVSSLGDGVDECSKIIIVKSEIPRFVPWAHELGDALFEESSVPKLNGDREKIGSKSLYATTECGTVNGCKERSRHNSIRTVVVS
jgi:hypothetical protein